MSSEKKMNFLIKAILDGDVSLAIKEIKKLRKAKIKPERIIKEALGEVVVVLDGKCTIEFFNLLEIMMAGRVIIAIVEDLYPKGIPASQARGVIIIGTPEGDIHDLGKNIVKIMLMGKGYRVIDCGKNCPIEELINVAEKEAANAIFISGLISTIVPQVRKVKSMLIQRKLTYIKVVAGGGALKQLPANNLNVDFVAETVFDGINYLNKILEV